MEKKPKNEKNLVKDEEASQATGKKHRGADDGQGYDDIIGAFGKYQLMIFMFKILVGWVAWLSTRLLKFYIS